MDSVRACHVGGLDYLGHVEVALRWRGGSYMVGFVCSLYMHGADVFVRVDGY